MLSALTLLCICIFAIIIKKYFPPKSYYYTYITKGFWTICILAFILAMITQPKTVFEGSVSGLETWLTIVFPSLLPFFIASELLMTFGVVHFMGILLEPVMRPIFNVPGAGSFVLAIGFTSGFPIGAMVTAKLRKQKLCTRVEAERLICYTNNSSPLFMLVAVSVGMLHNPELGIIIAGAHYLASITLGIFLRYYARKDKEIVTGSISHGNLLKRAFQQMLLIQRQEKRPLGEILGNAVKNSVTNLLSIGGFIILFAVIIRLLTSAGVIQTLGQLIGNVLLPLGLSPELTNSLSSGFIEMTIGTKLACEASAPLLEKVIAVAMILGWGGLSVHAQVASMLVGTDIRMRPFFLSRLAHAILAATYTYIFLGPCYNTVSALSQPVFSTFGRQITTSPAANIIFFLLIFIMSITFIAVLIVSFYLIKNIRHTFSR
ncbi:sporulation integral membrane protein YlbJ [Desulfolucanica intricata]|uniref:sporulation integral membrane protein YlbJ n=1 Tax=Desulfolucanica intricata TaxID=1285191 RepID=UPI000833B4FB|nr:sporulation integral membrane protein YlbJ [Desulfolucanica intricata]